MKLWNKRNLLIASFTALAGGTMALGAWFSGIETAVRVDKTGVRLVSYEQEERHVEEQNLPAFTSVKVDVNNVNINVIQGQTYGLDMSYYENDLMDSPLQYEVENGKLTITQSTKNTKVHNFGVSLGFFNIGPQKTNEITIVIPKNTSLLDLDISNRYGVTNISDLSVQQIMVFAYNGKVNLRDIFADSIAVENYYGDTTIQNKIVQTIQDLQLSAENGDITIEGAIPQTMTVKNDYGNFSFKGEPGMPSDRVTIKAENGKMKLLQLGVRTLDITNSYGSINLEEVVAEHILIAAENANIVADNVICKSAEISNSYGSVHANTWFSSQLFIDGESTEIDIVGTLHGETQIKNNYGDTCLTLNDSQGDYQMELYSYNPIQIGDTTVAKRYHSDDPNAKHSLKIDSDNSQITLNFLE